MNGIFARQLFIRYTFNQGSLVYKRLPVLSRVYGS